MRPDPADLLTERIRDLLARPSPVLVALDGRSGVGKSTLAATVAGRLPSCAVVEGDDFYAGGTEAEWDARSAEEKAAQVIDWRRQRPVLEALASGRPASWHAYDWDAFDGRLEAEPTTCPASPVVILEGAYSARPELSDRLDLRVLLTTDDDARHARLRAREGDAYHDAWFRRWEEAEVHYFGRVMPPEAFDVVLHSPT